MRLSARPVGLPLANPFVIARESRTVASVVTVELVWNGVSGFGEAAPISRYGESLDSTLAWLGEVELGDDPWAFEEIRSRFPPGGYAGRAAVDAALHDLQGKLAGEPVYRLLGLRRDGPPTSWTVWLGEPDDMARRAEDAVRRGFERLKIKLGGRDGLDLARVRAVCSAVEVPVRIDVNEHWSLEEALELIPQMPVEFCEQPLPAGDPGAAELKRRSSVPIFLDEDCHTLADLSDCARLGHGINIKLAKSGGIHEALRMIHAARALGLGVMVGCMVESSLGIAAAAAIASLCDHADLDGNLLLAHDPWHGVEFSHGLQRPSRKPGLGVEPA